MSDFSLNYHTKGKHFFVCFFRVAQDLHQGERKAHLTLPNSIGTEALISTSLKAKTCDVAQSKHLISG